MNTSPSGEQRASPLQCVATRTNGQPCHARALPDSPFCMAHGPLAHELHVAGGSARTNANKAARLLPSRLQPMVRLLERVFADLYTTTTEKRSARDAVALASVALAVGRLYQAGEVEERLRLLEQRASDEGRFTDRRGNKQNGPIQWPTIPGA